MPSCLLALVGNCVARLGIALACNSYCMADCVLFVCLQNFSWEGVYAAGPQRYQKPCTCSVFASMMPLHLCCSPIDSMEMLFALMAVLVSIQQLSPDILMEDSSCQLIHYSRSSTLRSNFLVSLHACCGHAIRTTAGVLWRWFPGPVTVTASFKKGQE